MKAFFVPFSWNEIWFDLTPIEVFSAETPRTEGPPLLGLFKEFDAPFLKDASVLIALNGDIPKVLLPVLNGDSCPVLAVRMLGEIPAEFTPMFFSGETLKPEVPAFRPAEPVTFGPGFS